MENRFFNKIWWSPIVGVAFVAVAVTGTVLLFHVRVPGIKVLHEWMGLVLAVAGAVHLVIHWRTFWAYFRQRTARVALCIVVALGIALTLLGVSANPSRGPGAPTDSAHGERPPAGRGPR